MEKRAVDGPVRIFSGFEPKKPDGVLGAVKRRVGVCIDIGVEGVYP